MPLTRSDAGLQPRSETGLLLSSAACLALLVGDSAGLAWSPTAAPAALIVLPLLAVALARSARLAGSHCLHMAVFMAVGGGIGLLAGAGRDFGPLGLISLAGWCSVLPAFSIDGALARASIAPWSYAGMLIGCNLGMALSSTLFRPRQNAYRPLAVRYLFCNGWMVLGMLAAEAALPALSADVAAPPSAIAMVVVMFAGMIGGMWTGWWSVEWLTRGRNGAAPQGTH